MGFESSFNLKDKKTNHKRNERKWKENEKADNQSRKEKK